MNRSCREIEALIDARRSGLAEGERLLLEEHLAECSACGNLTYDLDAVLSVIDYTPRSLDGARRERIIERALANAEPRPLPARTRRFRALSLAAALAAAFGLGYALFTRSPPEVAIAPRPAHTEPAQAAPVRDVPAEAEAVDAVTPSAGSTLQFAHARVTAGHDVRLRFHAPDHLLELERGEIDVEVDPAAHAPFAVRTARFRVEVLGTGFRVTQSSVSVRHGRVRVLAADGAVLADALGAGEQYALPEPRLETARTPPRPAARVDVEAALQRARSALARGDARGAEALLATLGAHGPRVQRAEVETLRAECALVAGELATAEARYLTLSERYRDLAAGENALFSARNVARRRGDEARAQALGQRYLERYPHGQFASALAR